MSKMSHCGFRRVSYLSMQSALRCVLAPSSESVENIENDDDTSLAAAP